MRRKARGVRLSSRGERRSLLGKTKLGGRQTQLARRMAKLARGRAKSRSERQSLLGKCEARAAGKARAEKTLGSPLLGFLHPLLLFSLTSSTPWIPATYWFSIPLLLPIGFLTTLFLIRDIAAFKATCASFQFSSAPTPFPPCPLPQGKANNFHSLPL